MPILFENLAIKTEELKITSDIGRKLRENSLLISGKNAILMPDKTIRFTDDIREWGIAFEDVNSRVVGDDRWGEVRVSTVFMGYNMLGCFFETMIFGGELAGYQERYATYEEALRGHLHNLQLVRTYRMEGEVWSG